MSNNPPPYEAISLQLEELIEEAKNFLDGEPITTQQQADDIGLLMTNIRKLAKEADTQRMAEQKPAQDEIKKSQAKWKPLLSQCDTATDIAKKALVPWLTKLDEEKQAKAKALRETADAQLKAAQEALCTDDLSAKLDAEEALKEAQKADRIANAAAKEKAQAQGVGRAVGLRTVTDVEMTDPLAFGKWLWNNRRDEYLEMLAGVADSMKECKHLKIPGLIFHERKVAV